MRMFLQKRLDGSLAPACDTSERMCRKLAPGEAAEFDWKSKNTRSVKWHRRYFALCNMVYSNVEQIVMPNGDVILLTSVDVTHMVIKGLAGLYDAMITLPDGTRLGLIRSIAFDNMTAEEWAVAWTQIVNAVHKHILPQVAIAEIEFEIAKVAA